MAGKINPYDYEPEYSDDEDIGNVNVDKYEEFCRCDDTIE